MATPCFRRAPGCLSLLRTLGLCGLVACASPDLATDWATAHPDWRAAPPATGVSLGSLVASLHAPAATTGSVPPPTLGVERLRVLWIDPAPWKTLDPAALADLEIGPEQAHAVLVARHCQRRQGLRRLQARRASWFLFRGGRLAAWEHYHFDGDCVPSQDFVPSGSAEADVERSLVRQLARLFPSSHPTIEERYRMGLAYVAQERIDDARLALATADASRRARRDAEDAGDAEDRGGSEPSGTVATPDQDRDTRERRARAELVRAIDEVEGRPADPEQQFWKGY